MIVFKIENPREAESFRSKDEERFTTMGKTVWANSSAVCD